MKRILISSFLILLMSLNVMAWELVPLTVSFDDDKPIGHSTPRTPISVPKVYIEDYTLSFGINHPEYVLIIKDENGQEVYTTTVFSTQPNVILPSTLSGNYEINLVMSNWSFNDKKRLIACIKAKNDVTL